MAQTSYLESLQRLGISSRTWPLFVLCQVRKERSQLRSVFLLSPEWLESQEGKGSSLTLLSLNPRLCCGLCQGLACSSWLKAITQKVRTQSFADDPWCSQVQMHLADGKEPKPFVGHLCEWQQQKKMMAQVADTASQACCFDGSSCATAWPPVGLPFEWGC
jgi:hypothetical protein